MNKTVAERIQYLIRLGVVLQTPEVMQKAINIAKSSNAWFVDDFVRTAIQAIYTQMLTEDALATWLSAYQIPDAGVEKTIGIITAGNIPLVGFHDFLCAYVCGCKIKLKLSSKDDQLLPYVIELLGQIDSTLKQEVQIIERLENFDAVIATGSNNSHRYFEYYFRQYPKVLRHNRNSVAILTGTETTGQLSALADDVFMYFGLGCRNVSKLYVPVGYELTWLFPAFEKYKWLHHHSRYMNNYDYHRSILLLNNTPHLANEFIMLQENKRLSSPIAMLYYEYYEDYGVPKSEYNKIQCIVGINEHITLGDSQKPTLSDYADGVDIVNFLLSLKTFSK